MKSKLFLLGILFPVSMPLSAEIFEAIGYGETADAARKNAVTNAIKMSVGEFVVNKQELHNEDFSEKTINYSNAYVKSSRVISEQQVNGEYEVKVAVDIESQKLLEILKETQTAKISIDRNQLKQQIRENEKNSAHNEIHHFEQLVDELLIRPIQEKKSLVEVKIVSDVHPIGTKNNKGEIPFEFEIEIIPSAEYRANVKRIMQETIENNPTGIRVGEKELFLNKLSQKKDPSSIQYRNTEKMKVIREAYSKVCFSCFSSTLPKFNIQLLGNDYSLKGFKSSTIASSENIAIYINGKIVKEGSFSDSSIMSAFSVRDLISRIDSNGAFYVYGKLKLKVNFVLTEDEVEELQDIKVFFSY